MKIDIILKNEDCEDVSCIKLEMDSNIFGKDEILKAIDNFLISFEKENYHFLVDFDNKIYIKEYKEKLVELE